MQILAAFLADEVTQDSALVTFDVKRGGWAWMAVPNLPAHREFYIAVMLAAESDEDTGDVEMTMSLVDSEGFERAAVTVHLNWGATRTEPEVPKVASMSFLYDAAFQAAGRHYVRVQIPGASVDIPFAIIEESRPTDR